MYIQTLKYSTILSVSLLASHYVAHGYVGAENYIAEQVSSARNKVIVQVADNLGLEPKRPAQPTQATQAKTPSELVANSCAAVGVSPQLGLAVMHSESRGDASAQSRAGAIGLMQVMPANAKACGLEHPGRLWEPELNARCGCQILRGLLTKYPVPDALRAYNAGEGNMRKRYTETENYTRKTMERFIQLLTESASA